MKEDGGRRGSKAERSGHSKRYAASVCANSDHCQRPHIRASQCGHRAACCVEIEVRCGSVRSEWRARKRTHDCIVVLRAPTQAKQRYAGDTLVRATSWWRGLKLNQRAFGVPKTKLSTYFYPRDFVVDSFAWKHDSCGHLKWSDSKDLISFLFLHALLQAQSHFLSHHLLISVSLKQQYSNGSFLRQEDFFTFFTQVNYNRKYRIIHSSNLTKCLVTENVNTSCMTATVGMSVCRFDRTK